MDDLVNAINEYRAIVCVEDLPEDERREKARHLAALRAKLAALLALRSVDGIKEPSTDTD